MSGSGYDKGVLDACQVLMITTRESLILVWFWLRQGSLMLVSFLWLRQGSPWSLSGTYGYDKGVPDSCWVLVTRGVIDANQVLVTTREPSMLTG